VKGQTFSGESLLFSQKKFSSFSGEKSHPLSFLGEKFKKA
jgi:hypothetical protein